MADIEVKNAIIQSVSIDTERCLTAWLTLDYGGTCQGFGGYVLFYSSTNDEKRNNRDRYLGNYAGVFIQRCIEIGGVEKWEQLPGKTIRVRGERWGSIHAIGHIVKDDWFAPKDEFERIRALVSDSEEK